MFINRETHPIVTGEEKVVSTATAIPIGVTVRDERNVVFDNVLETITCIASVRSINKTYNINDPYRDVEHGGFLGGSRFETAVSVLNLVHELAFNGINVV